MNHIAPPLCALTRWGWPPIVNYAVTLAAALTAPLVIHKRFRRVPPLRRLFQLRV